MSSAATPSLTSPRPPRHPRRFLAWSWQLVRDVARGYAHDGVGDLAAAITFWAILSLPAAALAIVSTLSELDRVVGASLVEDFENAIVDLVEETFVDATSLVDATRELFQTNQAGVATAATLVAVYSLSRAFAGLIRALDRAYGVDEARPWWFVRLLGVLLGLGTVAIVAASSTLLAFLPSLPFASFTHLLTVPLIVGVVVLWTATVFHFGPNQRTPWRYDFPGAVFSAIGWLGAVQLFALYLRVVGSDDLRSALGAIVLALTLLHLLGIILLVGAEVNDVIARRAGVAERRTTLGEHAQRLRRAVREAREV